MRQNPVINYFVPVTERVVANVVAEANGFGPEMFAEPAWPSTDEGGKAYLVASSPTPPGVLVGLLDLVEMVPGAKVFPGDMATAAMMLHIREPDPVDFGE